MKYAEGRYKATVTEFLTFRKVGKNDTPLIELGIRPHTLIKPSGEEEPVEQANRTVDLFMTEKSSQYSIPKLKAAGMEGKFSDYIPGTPGAKTLAGNEVIAWCKYNKDGYEEWDIHVPGSGGGADAAAKKTDPNVAARLDNLFGDALKSAKPQQQKEGPKVPDPEPVASPPADDDELPF